MKNRIVAAALGASLAFATPALAVEWNFYHHQSAPLFATSRGAKLITEELEKATNGEVKGDTTTLEDLNVIAKLRADEE